ncbi:unnamed protein product, partial [marine sediment metagenome]
NSSDVNYTTIVQYTSAAPDSGFTGGHTILSKGGGGTWDAGYVSYITQAYILGCFYTLYTGASDPGWDGIGWAFDATGGGMGIYAKHKSNPIITPTGNGADFDGVVVNQPAILMDGSTFYIWYTGSSDTVEYGGSGLYTIP